MQYLQPPQLQYDTRNNSPRSNYGQKRQNVRSSKSATEQVRQRTKTSGNIVQIRGVPMNQRQKDGRNLQQKKMVSLNTASYRQTGLGTQNSMGDSQPSVISKNSNPKNEHRMKRSLHPDDKNDPFVIMTNSHNSYQQHINSKKQDQSKYQNRRLNYKQKYDGLTHTKLQTQDDYIANKFVPRHLRNKKVDNVQDQHHTSHYDYMSTSVNNDEENHDSYVKIHQKDFNAKKHIIYGQQSFNDARNSKLMPVSNNHKHDHIDTKNHKFSFDHNHNDHIQPYLKKTYDTDRNFQEKKQHVEIVDKQKKKNCDISYTERDKNKYPPKVPSFLQHYKTERIPYKQSEKKNQPCEKTHRSDKQVNQNGGNYLATISKSHRNQRKNRKYSFNHIDNFTLIKKLGKGSYGNVFLAQDIQTSALFAVKIMHKGKIRDCQNEQNIFRQLKIHLYLEHRHIVQLYGIFDDPQYIYLVMEYQNQGSLFDILKQKITFSQKKTAKAVKQLIEALAYMHQQRIIHRDLKLENIMCCNGVLKIGDFGCAVHTFNLRQTKIGSLAYHSPEQLMEGQYDQKVDIWSLGIIVYELLYGQTPFDEDIIKIVRHEPNAKLSDLKFPSTIKISNEAKDFITKLLQKKPEKRMTINQASHHPFILYNTKEKDYQILS